MNNPQQPQVFQITTLRDIFNLPSIEQMVRCLDELKEGMIFARQSNDLVLGVIKDAGHDIKQAFEWPETVQWTDDKKANVDLHFNGLEGEEGFSIHMRENENDPGEGTPFFPQLSGTGVPSETPPVARVMPATESPTPAGVYDSLAAGRG